MRNSCVDINEQAGYMHAVDGKQRHINLASRSYRAPFITSRKILDHAVRYCGVWLQVHGILRADFMVRCAATATWLPPFCRCHGIPLPLWRIFPSQAVLLLLHLTCTELWQSVGCMCCDQPAQSRCVCDFTMVARMQPSYSA